MLCNVCASKLHKNGVVPVITQKRDVQGQPNGSDHRCLSLAFAKQVVTHTWDCAVSDGVLHPCGKTFRVVFYLKKVNVRWTEKLGSYVGNFNYI